MRWRAALLVVPVLLAPLAGCTARRSYAPEDLRAEVARRVPQLSEKEVVVPFEVSPDLVERARQLVDRKAGQAAKVKALVDSLSSPSGFGLDYRWAVTTDARGTIAAGGGNCLSLSSLLVGLARPLGLKAYYIDAPRNTEKRKEADLTVWAGHVGVMIPTEQGHAYVDFSGELPEGTRFRVMDDLEAVAHYYNNRGYEIIHDSRRGGTAVPWDLVRREFETATLVKPDMAIAWNNLGVALRRLERYGDARRAFRTAIERDPRQRSAQRNLDGMASLLDPATEG